MNENNNLAEIKDMLMPELPPIPEGEKAILIIDTREPTSIKGIGDEIMELPADAVIIGEHRKYVVERKTIDDLYNSVKDGRLWRQLRNMEAMRDEAGFIPLLVIIGDFGKLLKIGRITLPMMLGIQVAFSSFGVTVIHLKKKEHYIFLLQFLRSKAGKPRRYSRPTIPKPITRTADEERMDVLCAIRGIGEKTADELLRKFGSLKELFSAPEKAGEILGGKKLEHFLEIIEGKYGGDGM